MSLALLPHINRRQLSFWDGCSLIHETHNRVNVDVIVILRRSGWCPELHRESRFCKLPSYGKVGLCSGIQGEGSCTGMTSVCPSASS